MDYKTTYTISICSVCASQYEILEYGDVYDCANDCKDHFEVEVTVTPHQMPPLNHLVADGWEEYARYSDMRAAEWDDAGHPATGKIFHTEAREYRRRAARALES